MASVTFEEKVTKVQKMLIALSEIALWNPVQHLGPNSITPTTTAAAAASATATNGPEAASGEAGNGEPSWSNLHLLVTATKAAAFEEIFEPLEENLLEILQESCTNEDGPEFIERQEEILQQFEQKVLQIEEQLNAPMVGHDYVQDVTAIMDLLELQMDNRKMCFQAQLDKSNAKMQMLEAKVLAQDEDIAEKEKKLLQMIKENEEKMKKLEEELKMKEDEEQVLRMKEKEIKEKLQMIKENEEKEKVKELEEKLKMEGDEPQVFPEPEPTGNK